MIPPFLPQTAELSHCLIVSNISSAVCLMFVLIQIFSDKQGYLGLHK